MILRKNKSQKGIAFHKSGKGNPIVLIHGLGLSAECWYKQISVLKKNYTVYGCKRRCWIVCFLIVSLYLRMSLARPK